MGMKRISAAAAALSGMMLSACLFDKAPTPDRTVKLYLPLLDSTLAPAAVRALKNLSSVTVKDGLSGEVIRYERSEQEFGSWNSRLEFLRNLYHLNTLFLFQNRLPDTSGMQSDVAKLYAEVGAIDRFTTYYDKSIADVIAERIFTTNTKGIGVHIKLNDAEDSLTVLLVAPESPAERAGIRRGDRIVEVNDSSVTGDSVMVRFSRFTQIDDDAVIRLGIFDGSQVKRVSVVKEEVKFPTVLVDSVQNTGYIAVFSFTSQTIDSGDTYTEFAEALRRTSRFPVTVLDFRGNGGGSLHIALKMCEEVIASGVIIRQYQRTINPFSGAPTTLSRNFTAKPGDAGEGRRFVLVTDRGTASASEIFALAVREALNAPQVGDTTHGKGIGQSVLETPDGGMALITSLKFTGRSGLDYHGLGLAPDILGSGNQTETLALAVKTAEDGGSAPLAKQSAQQRRKALEVLEWNRRQMLRPGVSEMLWDAD